MFTRSAPSTPARRSQYHVRSQPISKVLHNPNLHLDIDPAMSREERLKKLKVSWGFDCNCSRCTQPRIFTDASDARLKLIAEITEKLADKTQNRTGSIDDAKLLISLYEQERLDAPIAEAYTYAALEENYVGNTVKAKKWAAMALEMNLLYGGPKDPDFGYMQQLFDDPKAHWSWMYTVNWKVNDPKNAQVKDEKKDPESLAAAAADSVAALKAMFGSVYA